MLCSTLVIPVSAAKLDTAATAGTVSVGATGAVVAPSTEDQDVTLTFYLDKEVLIGGAQVSYTIKDISDASHNDGNVIKWKSTSVRQQEGGDLQCAMPTYRNSGSIDAANGGYGEAIQIEGKEAYAVLDVVYTVKANVTGVYTVDWNLQYMYDGSLIDEYALNATTTSTITVGKVQTAQTIDAADVTATFGAADAKVVATSSDTKAVITYAVTEGGDVIGIDAATGALTVKKVGTAKVTVSAAATAESTAATKEVTVTINPAIITKVVLSAPTAPKTGEKVPAKKTPVQVVSTTGIVGTAQVTASVTYKIGGENGSDVTTENFIVNRTYWGCISLTLPANHAFDASTQFYVESNLAQIGNGASIDAGKWYWMSYSTGYTVFCQYSPTTRLTPTVTFEGGTAFEYNGNAQSPTYKTDPALTGATVKETWKKHDGTGYAIDTDKPTDAGKYLYTVEIGETDTTAAVQQPIEFEIRPKEITTVELKDITPPMTGAKPDTEVTVVTPNVKASVQWYNEETRDLVDGVFAGSSVNHVTIELEPENSNYVFADSMTITLDGKAADYCASVPVSGALRATWAFDRTEAKQFSALVDTALTLDTQYTLDSLTLTDDDLAKTFTVKYTDNSTGEVALSACTDITGWAKGATTLTATYEGQTFTLNVPAIKGKEIKSGETISLGELDLTYTGSTLKGFVTNAIQQNFTDLDGNPITVSSNDLIWSVSLTPYVEGTLQDTNPVTNAGTYKLYLYQIKNSPAVGAVYEYPEAEKDWKILIGEFVVKQKDIANAEIEFSEPEIYNGSEYRANIKDVKLDGKTLNGGFDYDITSGGLATNVGDTTLVITGKGNNYTGTATKVWSLQKATPTAADFAIPTGLIERVYTGSAITVDAPTVVESMTGMGAVTVKYADANGNPIEAPIYAGTYTLTFDVAEGQNFTAATGLAYGTLTIEAAADPAVITTEASVTKGGYGIDLKKLVTGAKGAISFEQNTSASDLGCLVEPPNSGTTYYTSYQLTGTDDTVYVVIADTDVNNDNIPEYEGRRVQLFISVVNKQTIDDITITGMPDSVEYGDTITLTANTAQTGGKWAWTYDTDIFKADGATDAATDAATIKLTAIKASPDAASTITAKYENDTHLGSGSADVTVEKKLLTVDTSGVKVVKVFSNDSGAGTLQGDLVLNTVLGQDEVTAGAIVRQYSGYQVGEYTVEIFVQISGQDAFNYTLAKDTFEVPGEITKYQLEIQSVTLPATREYDQKSSFELERFAVKFVDLPSSVGGIGITAVADMGTADVDTGKPVTVTVTLSEDAAKNYELKNNTYAGTIDVTRADYTGTKTHDMNVWSNKEAEYSLDLGAILNQTTGMSGYSFGTVSTADSNAIVKATPSISGTTLKFNTNAVAKALTATVTVPVLESKNYNAFDFVITLTTSDKQSAGVTIKGAPATNPVYGDSFTLSVELQAAGDPPTSVKWTSSDSNVIEINATTGVATVKGIGTATVTVSYESATTIGTANVTITTDAKKLVKPAADTTVYTYTGAAQTYKLAAHPDYTVTGATQTNAGTYTVTVALKDKVNNAWPDGTTADLTYTFTIKPATVTITGSNLNAKVGDAVPSLSDYQYTVTGFIGNDDLDKLPDVAYEKTPDMTKLRETVEIVLSGAMASSNYTIVYVNGKLTVDALPTFAITVEPSVGGTVTASAAVSEAGKSISLTATPAEGYTFSRWAVTPASVAVTGDTTAVFVMPGEAVTVKAIFAKVAPTLDFEVSDSSSHGSNGTIAGVNDTMEYSADGGQTWIPVEAGQTVIANLAPGSYLIRYRATGNAEPSPAVTVQINQKSFWSENIMPIVFRLYFETNGGKEIAPQLRMLSNRVDFTKITTTREGYTFTGWYADPALTLPITETRMRGNLVVYAGWAPIVVEQPTEEKPIEGQSTELPVEQPTETPTESQPAAAENPFTDVAEADWFYDSVLFAVDNALMTGATETAFAPGETVTRGAFIKMLWQIEGCPTVAFSADLWDVPADADYREAIEWALMKGLLSYNAGIVSPATLLTRDQMVTIVYRYATMKEITGDVVGKLDGFADLDKLGEWAKDAMAWATGNGILHLRSADKLDPAETATRAELAAILHGMMTVAGSIAD